MKLFRPTDPIVEELIGEGSGSALDFFVTPTYESYITIQEMDAAATLRQATQDHGGTQSITFDNNEAFMGHVIGLAPHGALALQLWDKDIIADFFNAEKYGSIVLDVTAGSSVGSSSTAEIVIQQMRPYQ